MFYAVMLEGNSNKMLGTIHSDLDYAREHAQDAAVRYRCGTKVVRLEAEFSYEYTITERDHG